MAAFTAGEYQFRVLGLGNEIIADDAFGILAAREIERRFGDKVDVVCSSASGFHLMDHLLGARRLMVIDAIMTGGAKPGTMYVLRENDLKTPPACAPHGAGLFEVLDAARGMNLPAPEEMIILAVEIADFTSIGGDIHPDVLAAIPTVVDAAERWLAA